MLDETKPLTAIQHLSTARAAESILGGGHRTRLTRWTFRIGEGERVWEADLLRVTSFGHARRTLLELRDQLTVKDFVLPRVLLTPEPTDLTVTFGSALGSALRTVPLLHTEFWNLTLSRDDVEELGPELVGFAAEENMKRLVPEDPAVSSELWIGALASVHALAYGMGAKRRTEVRLFSREAAATATGIASDPFWAEAKRIARRGSEAPAILAPPLVFERGCFRP